MNPIPLSMWESQGNVWPTKSSWYNMLRPENLRNELVDAGVAVKPKIFGPLTLLGFSVVDSFFLQSSTVRIAPGSYQPMIHVA